MFQKTLTALTALAAFALPAAAYADGSAWPVFRGGFLNPGTSPFRLGNGDTSGPAEVKEVPLGGLIWATPVIGQDGTVYLGTTGKHAYAVSPEGELDGPTTSLIALTRWWTRLRHSRPPANSSCRGETATSMPWTPPLEYDSGPSRPSNATERSPILSKETSKSAPTG